MPNFIGDVDFVGDTDPNFAVSLVAGHTYYIDLEGVASATTAALGDGFLYLQNSAGTRILSDDDGGVGANARIVYTPTVTGTYIVEPAGFGSNIGHYQLHINEDDYRGTPEGNGAAGALGTGGFGSGTLNFATSLNNDNTSNIGDRDVFAVSLTAGRTYHFEELGAATGDGTVSDGYLRLLTSSGAGTVLASDDDGGVGSNARIVYTPTTSGTYYLQAGSFSDFGTGTYRVFAHQDEYRDSTEGNGAAGAINTGGTGTASLQVAGDKDIWGVTLINGLTYTIDERGSASAGGTLADPFLALQNSAGTVLSSDDDSGTGSDSRIVYQATTTGTHYLAAGAFGNAYAGTYALAVSLGVATSAANTITGTGVADAIDGAGGNDTVSGGGGNDSLYGNVGNDQLRGGAGSDFLSGGPGVDVLIGGAGADRFDFNNVIHSTPTASDILRAGDGGLAFDGAGAAVGDRIDLADIDANSTTAANDTFIFGGTGKGHIWLTESGTNTILHGNVDNDAAAEFQVVIEDAGIHAAQYVASDFIL